MECVPPPGDAANTAGKSDLLMDRYLAAGREAGCPLDQMRNFSKAALILQKRQLLASAAARECDREDGPTEIGFGGARGGGKSYWILAQMGADDCQRFAGLKCLLLRRVGKANIEHFEDLRHTVFANLPHEFAAHRGVLTFANGSKIVAGHFQSESDIDNYLGLEYDVIAVEEATSLSSRKYEQIGTCCRSSKRWNWKVWRPRVYSNANPGGIGHAYYKSRFVDPYLRGCQTGTRFVPSRVTDNAFNNAEYKGVLERLTGWQRRAWLDGDWDIAAGQYFTNFRRDAHVVTHWDDGKAVEWFAALDYGFTHYTVVLLGARDGDGNVVVVDEHAERLWLPERHASAIRAMLARHQVRLGAGTQGQRSLRYFVAGSDVFSRESDGKSIAGEYRSAGILLKPAAMNRVNGWAEIMARLGDPKAGVKPTLFIHERCARLIETLPVLQRDPLRPEDVLKVDADEEGKGEDDAADALRYLVGKKTGATGAGVA